MGNKLSSNKSRNQLILSVSWNRDQLVLPNNHGLNRFTGELEFKHCSVNNHCPDVECLKLFQNYPNRDTDSTTSSNTGLYYTYVCGPFNDPSKLPVLQSFKPTINKINPLTKNIKITANISPKETETHTLSCKICYANLINLVFQPCGHALSCNICAEQLKNCPICRETIKESIRTIFA